MTKTRSKLADWKAFVNTMGIIVPIWNKFFLIHISTNQITKVDCKAFLSQSESRNLGLLYHFGGDSTLVPSIPNVRDWLKHRFGQRLWSVSMRQNESDFQQFSPAFSDIIFINEFNLFKPMADFLFLTLNL